MFKLAKTLESSADENQMFWMVSSSGSDSLLETQMIRSQSKHQQNTGKYI